MFDACSRRGALALFGGAAASAFSAPSVHPIRFGGPVFLKSDDPRELAREHRRMGYSAAYCPPAKPDDSARTHAIEAAYAAENVIIAEVGAWSNMLDPDPDKRQAALRLVIEKLTLADAVNARCCVNIAGSYNPKVWYGPHPENLTSKFFDATVENCRKVIDEVKPRRARFAIEMMGWSVPDGPDSYVRLFKAVDRKQFGVHIDVCNGINSPERFYRNGEFTSECFRKLGEWIVSCHAKDLDWIPEMNVHFVEVIPGRGKIDYRPYLRGVAALSTDAPLMLEHLKTAEDYEEGKKYITGVAEGIGIAFA